MKKKKIFTMISAVAMAATMGVTSLAGCDNNKHKHSYVWVTDYEATCVLPGQKTGTCVCGDVKAEVIPVDPEAHEFDKAWDVTKPTETTVGRATRTCKNSKEHTFDVELPKLSEEDKYDSAEITKKPTIVGAGNRRYVLFHSAGDIEFDIELPRRTQIENVEDVALYACSLRDNIRRSDGNYVEGDPDGTDVNAHEFYNYYGDNYIRVHDGGNRRDFWYSRDDDNRPFGISAEVQTIITNEPEDPENPPEGWKPIMGEVARDPRVDESVTEQNLLGFGYTSGGGMRATYGAEDTLQTYYEASQSETAIKYNETYLPQANGSYVCSFEFSRMEQTHFCRYYVDFETYPSGEIKTLSVKTKIIRTWMLANSFDGTNTGEIIYDEDGDIIFSEIYPISTSTGSEEYEVEYKRDENGDIVYNYTYMTDEEGKTIVDENGNPVIATDNNGNPIKSPVISGIKTGGYKQKPDGTPLLDRFGNQIARPLPLGWKDGDEIKYYYEADDAHEKDHPYIAIRSISFTQTLKVDGEEVEENPYPAESVYIHSFDVSYDGKSIAKDETVEISANTPALFKISNVQPADTAKLDFDPLMVFVKGPAGEIELGPTGDNVYHIVGHFRREENVVYINAQHSGEVTIVLRTLSGKCERELKLDIAKGVPSDLNAQAYLYSDAGGSETHSWTNSEFDYDNPSTAWTIYEGQSLYIRGTAIASEANYVDASFVTALEDDSFAQYIRLEDGLELPDGTKVTKVTALAPIPADEVVGIFVMSVHTGTSGAPVAYKLVGIKVVAAPSVNDMFTGSYTGRFNFINMVETGSAVSATVTVTFKPEAGTMDVKVSDGKNTATCVYGYTYDAQTREFTGTYVSGRNDATFRFTFALNEVYKLTIYHLTFPDRDRSETIVLSRPQ